MPSMVTARPSPGSAPATAMGPVAWTLECTVSTTKDSPGCTVATGAMDRSKWR